MSDFVILSVQNLSVTYGGLAAVSNASFEISRDEITSIVGPNGAGKTTLFNLISGISPCDEGLILFEGKEIQKLLAHEIARMGLIRTFQGAKVIKRLSLIENVMLARQSNPGDRLLNFPRFLTRKKFEAETRDLAMSYLSTVGLTPLANEFAGILSGGQRKLLDLARSLMAEPKLLMLDEPFAGVNPKLRDTLLEILVKMKSENKIPLVLVEHDLDTVKQISNKVIVLAQGSVIAQGGPEDIFNDQKVIDAYIGTRRH